MKTRIAIDAPRPKSKRLGQLRPDERLKLRQEALASALESWWLRAELDDNGKASFDLSEPGFADLMEETEALLYGRTP